MRIILDTNIFNSILDGFLQPDLFLDHEIFVTHIQRDELGDTPDDHRRSMLLRTFASIPSISVPTKTSVWGDTRWGEGQWSTKDGLYDQLVDRIKELDNLNKKKKPRLNQSRDARIAEVAIANQIVLITNDLSLATATKEHSGQALSLREFQAL